MLSSARNYLHYARTSLADACCFTPDFDLESPELSASELNAGKLSSKAVREIERHYQKQNSPLTEQERKDPWPLPVLVCPLVYSVKGDHQRASRWLPGTVVPVVISACLHKDGHLSVDEQRPRPFIPREFLFPTKHDVAIGTVEQADTAYAKTDAAYQWEPLLESARKLVRETSGDELESLKLDGYVPGNARCKLFTTKQVPATNLLRFLDHAVADQSAQWPLLDKLIKGAKKQPLKSARELLKASALHWGQMESQYGLSPSQREALLHFIADDGSSILAIDGPPGTGKTTLLLSIVASKWVASAVAGGDAPLIVATSTNNQAVVNVLEAFWKATQDSVDSLAGRWLKEIKSYGLFLRAKSPLKADRHFPIQELTNPGAYAVHDARCYEDKQLWLEAQRSFIQRVETCFGQLEEKSLKAGAERIRREIELNVEHIRKVVQALLAIDQCLGGKPLSRASVQEYCNGKMQEIGVYRAKHQAAQENVSSARALYSSWAHHESSEPLLMQFLAWLGIDGPRRKRDHAFCAQPSIVSQMQARKFRSLQRRREIQGAFRGVLDDAESTATATAEECAALERGQAAFTTSQQILESQCVSEGSDFSRETVETALDTGPRLKAFRLATHYWEARFLIETQAALTSQAGLDETKEPTKLEQQFRRLAKLWPCYVSTLHTFPDRFSGERDGVYRPCYNMIDLLIVDEAGQVAPDIGVPAFAFAKRAVVVGDVDQLPPIWSVAAAIDRHNAIRHGVANEEEMNDFRRSGFAACDGRLMEAAKRATPFAKFPDRGRGLFLSEHRRCWPEIIEICNRLVYEGRLVPCREEGERKLMPSLGYAHIPGTSTLVGKSRRNDLEAQAIAQWLAGRRAQITEAFEKDSKTFGRSVAVIAPFAAQAQAIKAELRRTLGEHEVLISTVHAMQGAERRIVIFSPAYGVETDLSATRFTQDVSLLNVTISRAQDAFLVFGNMDLFHPAGTGPTAVIGRALLKPEQEIKDVPLEQLLPVHELAVGQLITDLPGHVAVLADAFEDAKERLVIVSPFLRKAAIRNDGIIQKIMAATANDRSKKVCVKIVTDKHLNWRETDRFDECVDELRTAGAEVLVAKVKGVHSKLLLVDQKWFVIGSFNWLSAVRNEKSPYARYESSYKHQGAQAFGVIERSMKELMEVLSRAVR